MAKEWVLNQATNRWGLNKKRSVGPTSLWIREVDPQTVEDWERAYLGKLAEMLGEGGVDLAPDEYLQSLGEKLFIKITEVLHSEVAAITEADCVSYIRQLVIDRTFDGYRNEIDTIYGQLQDRLNVKIEAAPDEWDRGFNVDFFIRVGPKFIGLQIKPLTFEQMADAPRWGKRLSVTHDAFSTKHGGRVFIIFSTKSGSREIIHNEAIVDEIRAEIDRLDRDS